ncbi:hypothetical protein EB118_18835 [bacterium]|nr:hypothetical protein [bacterium]
MSFWNDLAQGFNGQPVMPRPVPETIRRQIRRIRTWNEAKEVTDFLVDNFGDPPRTPVFRVPPSELYGPEYIVNTFAYYIPTSQVSESIHPPIDLSKSEILVGSIRYRLWARSQPIVSSANLEEIPENCQSIFAVDCFCVDRRFRSKGRKIGTWLLKYLHYFANTNAIPYAVFMKEGKPLAIPSWPFRSGIYAWIKIPPARQAISSHTKMPLNQIREDRALAWLYNYYNLQQNLLINSSQLVNKILKSSDNPKLYPMTHNQYNAFWYLYRDSVSLWILIRVENTNQIHTKGGNIGYFTDVYISHMFNSDKIGLSGLLYEIACHISKIHNYSWVWLDSELVVISQDTDTSKEERLNSNRELSVTGEASGLGWKVDGPYNWYGFQW